MPRQKITPWELKWYETIFLPYVSYKFNIVATDAMAMNPPKTEPAVPQPDLEIVNPYVPLAHYPTCK